MLINKMLSQDDADGAALLPPRCCCAQSLLIAAPARARCRRERLRQRRCYDVEVQCCAYALLPSRHAMMLMMHYKAMPYGAADEARRAFAILMLLPPPRRDAIRCARRAGRFTSLRYDGRCLRAVCLPLLSSLRYAVFCCCRRRA